ncbi:ACP phosphodiesterase [Marinilongibacter aquaticus]|uniref:acyl carrier protein phosphodiesterase n=1 Tax=Marinilongibacter aquaticus TaxID=2975157 RepID=UPI0021BD3BA8|nr:ACP phosphodiesterase [Marinilongibacter aquaticus]UBM59557.1 ACP phosphodiesterase [Marinilongibacter aquaticus]
MNYLAHLFLSGTDEEIIFGNMLEDFIHGQVDHPRHDKFNERIKTGIRLHRQIDTLTDTHPIVKTAKQVFHAELGRYDSVVIDVVFDHYLIKHWAEYTQEAFEDFRKRIYAALGKFQDLMPERLLKTYQSMVRHDWLTAYEFDEGLERAFSGLNKKIHNGPDLIKSISIMHENYAFLNQHFLLYFDVLKMHCDQFLADNT